MGFACNVIRLIDGFTLLILMWIAAASIMKFSAGVVVSGAVGLVIAACVALYTLTNLQ